MKAISLAEDEVILEKLLPGLKGNKLHELVLHNDGSLNDLAATLGRPNNGHSLALRWAHQLQPWIMQHYAGTLNLDIRLMLVNHLAKTYQSRDSVDWNAVADISEFAGNTAKILKYTFTQLLHTATKSLTTEMSWEQMLNKCKLYISQNNWKRHSYKKTEMRSFQVIQYFEKYVKRHKLKDYL